MSAFSVTAFAAKYKVNTGGRVTAPDGTHQNSSVLNNSANVYSNYSAKNYVNNRQVQKAGVSTIDIVMDYSGSMYYWINEAKKTMGSIVSQLPAGTSVGFRVFGHDGGYNKYSPVLSKIKSITKKSDGGYKVSTKKDDFLDGKFEYYFGLIYAYRRVAIEAGKFSHDIANTIRSTRRPAPLEFDDYYRFGNARNFRF